MRSLLSSPGFSTNIKSYSVHCDPLSCMASGSRCHTADYLKETKDVDGSVPGLLTSLLKPHIVSTNIKSDRVHCNPLSCEAFWSRCHTTDYLKEMKEVDGSVPCYLQPIEPPPPLGPCVPQVLNSSLHTQCAAAASADAHCPTVFHCRLCCARKKHCKQDLHLREMVVPPNQVKMSITEIDSKVIVVDGGGEMSPLIRPPHEIWWRSIPVRDLHIEEELSGDMFLSFPRNDGTSPFICLPCRVSLEIISHVGLPALYDALSHCKKLRRVALCQSDHKRVFTDYGKHVTYTCVGPQPSRISNTVLNNPPFVDALPQHHWEKLVLMMKRAEISFCFFTDHCVLSHLHHAKKLVPFRTFSSTVDKSSTLSSKFFGLSFHIDSSRCARLCI